MQLQVKGKNVSVTDALFEHAERKLEKLTKMLPAYEDDATTVELELSVEKNPKVERPQVAEVTVRTADTLIQTGLKKFGAIVGDRAEIGCHAVLSPGSLIGPEALIYPGLQWKGVLAARSIAKLRQDIETGPRSA